MKHSTKSVTETDGRYFLWIEMKKIVNFISFQAMQNPSYNNKWRCSIYKNEEKSWWKIDDTEVFLLHVKILKNLSEKGRWCYKTHPKDIKTTTKNSPFFAHNFKPFSSRRNKVLFIVSIAINVLNVINRLSYIPKSFSARIE